MLKKVTLVALLSVVVFALVGCEKTANVPAESTTVTQNETSEVVETTDSTHEDEIDEIDDTADENTATLNHGAFYKESVPGPNDIWWATSFEVLSQPNDDSEVYSFLIFDMTLYDMSNYVNLLDPDVFSYAIVNRDDAYAAATANPSSGEDYYKIMVTYIEDKEILQVICTYVKAL